MMVAQDARNKTQGLDRFGPSRGGNTLHPVCGCISLMLGRVLRDRFETWSFRGVWMLDPLSSKGVPLLPLYTRGAGLHDGVLVGLQGRSPSWLQLCLFITRKVGSYPYTAGSFL